jgi:heptosyltransferase-2
MRLIEKKEPLSFIVFRLDSLGDVVLTTPLFRELKKAYPKSRCTVVVQAVYKPLLVTNPNVDEILTLPNTRPAWLPQGMRNLLSAALFGVSQLHRRYFDFAISPRWDVDEHLATFLCLLTNARQRVGYSETASPAKRRLNRTFDAAFDICLPPGPVRHEALRNNAIVEALGVNGTDSSLDIRLTEMDRRNALKRLAAVRRSNRIVALGIGARSPGRIWPIERYAAVITRLWKCERVHAVILCSSAERGQAEKIPALTNAKTTVVSGAPIREVCAILERSALFIGNDSGCAHLAAAMHCKTIAISRHPRDGDINHCNSPVRFGPLGREVRVLQPATGTEGCEMACCSVEPHCIKAITVDEVTAVALEMLRREQPPVRGSVKPWSEKASRRLMCSHSAEAMQCAVEKLRASQLRSPEPH